MKLSRSSKLILAALLAVLVAGVYGWLFSRQPQTLPQLPEPIGTSPADNPLLAQSAELLAGAEQTLASTPAEPGAEPQVAAPVGDQPSATSPWQLATNAAAPSIPLAEGVRVYEPVAVDMENPRFPQPGDQLELSLPGADPVKVSVAKATTLANGDYSWSGHLQGSGTAYPVVMTYGADAVFATITTPQGSYTLESVNGSGWIYKNPAEVELTQPGKNDYLEVPEEELRKHELHQHEHESY